MGRVLLVIVLTTSLLACPYRCAGFVDVACATASTSQSPASQSGARCACCCQVPQLPVGEVEPAPHQPAPLAPAQDCQCGDCLCHGAVISDDDGAHDTFLARMWQADFCPPAVALFPGQWSTRATESPPLAVPIAGRPLRLALASLLI